MKNVKNLGTVILGVWLILNGLVGALSLSFAGLHMLMGLLALVAGILLVMGR